MKTAVRNAKESILKNENPQQAVKVAQSVVGHMVKRGVVHHRKAARITSRLMRKANHAAAAAAGQPKAS